MALFVSAETAFLGTVQAAPSFTLTPSHGIPGILVTAGTLAGYDPTDTSCTISGTPVSNPSTCTIAGGVTFTVKQYTPAGVYTITITGNAKGDSGQASFTVDEFTFTLHPTVGPTGIEVTFTLSNVPLYDTSCSVSGQPSGVVTVPACVVSAGTGNGSFIVGNVSPGDYVIEVTACTGNNGCSPSAGDYAQQVFIVTTPTSPKITLSPASSRTGIDVIVNGTGFAPQDQSCSISSLTSGFITNAGCSITAGTNATHGSFIVGNVAPGQYVVEVTACPGNNGCTPSNGQFAQQVFTVTSGPKITLSPASGPIGVDVVVNGTGFQPSDGSCTISSPSSGSIITTAGCAITSGTGTVHGSFIVGNVPPGQYVIEVTGCAGNNGCTPSNGDYAQSVFNVTTGARITLTPTIGKTGTHVSVSGTGFLPSDQSCSISSPGSSAVLAGSAGCSKNVGSSTLSGSFIIGNVAPGQYVIEVTACGGNNGCSPSAGDFAQAVFNVTSGPFIQLSGINGGFASVGKAAKGPVGTHVNVEGSSFLSTDTTCSISSPSSGSIILGAACSVFIAPSGFNNVTGSFIVGNVPEGQYVIQVTGNQGDFAQAIFNVTRGPFIQLFPTKGSTGTSVNIEGSYFLSTDTTCSISSPSSGSIIQGAACSTFKSSGTFLGFMNVTGSFVVGNVPTGEYVIQVSGNQGDFAQAVFNVTSGPFIQLGINGKFASVGQAVSGPIGTHVSVEGTHFLEGDTTCSLSSPTNGATVLNGACSFFDAPNGFRNATGSFTVGNVPEGQYVIQLSGNGGDFAQAIFNVTAGAFIQLGVNGVFAKVGKTASGPIGTHIDIEGSQFLANDAFNSATCSIGSPTSGSVINNGACSFFKTPSGFVNATGSFVVGNVPEGQYVIQVSGSAGDSAEAILNVTAGAFIQLGVNGIFAKVGQVANGPTGTHVSVEGSQFLANDAFNSATCSLSSPTSGSVIVGNACSFFKTPTGFVNVTGSFIVGNVPEGQYAITVSGSAGDSAQAVFNVTAGAFIQLGVNGIVVKIGQVANGPTGTHVSVEGSQFLPNDAFNSATCSIGSPTSGSIINNGACSFFKTTGGFVNVTGSFVVGNVPEGQYVIQVSGSAGDSAQAVFNVTAGAFIQLGVNGMYLHIGQVQSGPIGTHVSIQGSQFLADDAFNSATCSISSPSNGAIIVNGGCSFFKTTTGLVNATGSFIVGNVPEGQYVIQVSGAAGDSAQAVFNVTSGAFIQLGVSNGGFVSVGHTAKGPTGTHVSIEGSQFLPGDAFNSATCTISSPTSGSIIAGAACSFFKTSTGLVNATGSFIVGNVGAGQYVIQVSGSAGDSAQAIFNVTSGAFIQLRAAGVPGGFSSVGQVISGPLGTSVSFEGSFFTATATTCTVSSVSSGLVTGAGCSVFIPTSGGFVGFANVTGSFIVGNVLPGQYVVQVTDNTGSFAQAVFNVTLGAQIKLTPACLSSAKSGSAGACEPGVNVIVNGTGFLPTDIGCVISGPGSNVVEGGTAACSTRAGTGVISGSFLIGNVLPGQYLIQVTGSQGDFAQAVLYVPFGPILTLSPGTGAIGKSILVNGTSFLTTDQSCSISSISSPNPILIGSAGCAITVGTGNVAGSFIIGNVPIGEYVIEVTACAGNNGCAPSAGDFAQRVLNVTQGAPTLTLLPSSAVEEATVTFIGTGLSPSDTGCMVLAYNGVPPTTPDNTLITAPTCSIVSPGVAQGSFVVSPYATSDIHWYVVVEGTPADDRTPGAPFTVTPDVIVTPTSGTVNTVFTFTGSGFESTATTCTASVSAPFMNTTDATCSISNGQVSGSVFPTHGTVSGTYGVKVTDSTGSSATGIFTVGTPSALVVLNPASVEQGQSVGVAGTGFNPSDMYCVIDTNTPGLFAPAPSPSPPNTNPTCVISGGYASGSFTVSSTAAGGYYLVSVLACSVIPTITAGFPSCPAADTLDFASNFLGVTLASTVTTFSSTTTTSSTTTAFSTTTTSVATSFTYFSSTIQTTGMLFTTYTHLLLTTVSGQTVTTQTQLTSTTQTQTTVTYSTISQFTTVPCGPLPCGFAVTPQPMNVGPGVDSAGLLAALLLLVPMLLRRLFN
jgi:hypothetical protein